MCGCGIGTWCAGGCPCGCTHDTLEGQREQAIHFSYQYQGMRVAVADAYAAGVQAARDAVAALSVLKPNEPIVLTQLAGLQAALAAIDALRGE